MVHPSNEQEGVGGDYIGRLVHHCLGMKSGLHLNHRDFYIFSVSYERLNGNCLHSEQPTGNIVSMALLRGEEEPMIGPAQVDMPLASAV